MAPTTLSSTNYRPCIHNQCRFALSCFRNNLVPAVGVEPTRPCEHQLLRLACLPFHQTGKYRRVLHHPVTVYGNPRAGNGVTSCGPQPHCLDPCVGGDGVSCISTWLISTVEGSRTPTPLRAPRPQRGVSTVPPQLQECCGQESNLSDQRPRGYNPLQQTDSWLRNKMNTGSLISGATVSNSIPARLRERAVLASSALPLHSGSFALC